MRPAFTSTKSAAAFSLLLLVLLLLPAVLKKNWLPPREQIYSSLPWSAGQFPYLHQQIFEEKEDIDIAFMGSSHMWFGIDTPYVQEKLSERLGRPAVVRSICWSWAGFDALHFFSQDLLAHRKVHLLVFYDEFIGKRGPQRLAPRWFRLGDNTEDWLELPLAAKVPFYFAAVLGMPRNLLELVRTNLPAEVVPQKKVAQQIDYNAPNPATRLGSLSARGMLDSKGQYTQFSNFAPPPLVQPSNVSVYSPTRKAVFKFDGPPTIPWQLDFARKFAGFAQSHQTRLVILHIPTIYELNDAKIQEREFWPSALDANIAMLGIPSATLFTNLTHEDTLKLFAGPDHLNVNGQKWFTSLITPALLDLYASQTNR